MSLFGKLFKRHEDDFSKDFSSPPDFSQPVGQQPGGDPFAAPPQDSGFGQDPFASPQGGAPGGDPYGQQPSTFDHDIFNVSDQPGNADLARGYARQLGGQPQQQAAYSNPTAGHETQLVLERLDTIKAELDAIKQRMIRIERFMDQAEQKNQRRYI